MSLVTEKPVPVTDAINPPVAQSRFHKDGPLLKRLPLLPALVFMIIVTQVPFVLTLIISFFNWNSLYPNDVYFSWFSNYVAVFVNPDLRNAMLVTVQITVVVVLVSLLLGLGIALLLDRKFWGRGAVRTLLIAPFLIVPVAAALVWKHALYNPSYGLFNGILTWIWGLFGAGSQAPQPDWISQFPLHSVELELIWQWTPFMMLILLAGLQGRPLDVIEAAKMDGASEWQIFRYLTFPHLRQYLELAALLGSIYVVQTFDSVFTLTSGSLGTANLPFTIYQQFTLGHDYGGSSASGVVVVFLSIALATFALRTVSTLLKDESK
ncbi:carbohydrate ABC transporter permease [Subtercola boreus]|uniref:Sugar ABC transporter permease n=2 Tax=Subtercola boreus TaxID=120213 RepID=A0A3E0W6S4_9MICO|nr:sugar ABC transporter permease [Subtercola boreus]RFA17553.1 sugar ABC transporter permease [Subtercola boreus]RFA17603.1 sugar ABC transporter permease [Subtercola boreus]RFA24194.1 sugar ABC transporter permease [Subtercola boreus]